jgi:hypothetical protein
VPACAPLACRGLLNARESGDSFGRPPSIEASRVRELKAQGMRPVDIAKALQIGRASVYWVLGQKADNYGRCSCRGTIGDARPLLPGPAHEDEASARL